MESIDFKDGVKVAICIPTAGLIRAACMISVVQTVVLLGRERLWSEAKSQASTMYVREGSGIAPNRQKMVEEALAEDEPATHILFADDDMSWSAEAVASLARRRLPIVGCNYRMRFPPAEFTAVHKERERGRMQTNGLSKGLEPVSYMGFGLCLIESRVFKLLDKPWFLGRYLDDVYTTEDLPFFWQAAEKGITAYCDQDASKLIEHIGIHNYRWDQNFEQENKPTLKIVETADGKAAAG